MIKMKLCCLLLSFAFLNVLTVKANYLKVVETTNILIDWLCVDDEIWTVFKRLVSNDVLEYTMEEMALMIALPELEMPDYPILQSTLQRKMRAELLREADIPLNIVKDLASGEKSLNELGSERRTRTRQTLKLLILNILCQREPNVDFLQTCRIIGIFLSTKFPASYTTSAQVLVDNTCVLSAVDGSIKSYKQFGLEIHQVSNENHQRKEVNLVNQL